MPKPALLVNAIDASYIGYVAKMGTEKPILNFVVDPSALKTIDDFRYKHRFPTRAAAVKFLLDYALAFDPEVPVDTKAALLRLEAAQDGLAHITRSDAHSKKLRHRASEFIDGIKDESFGPESLPRVTAFLTLVELYLEQAR